MVQSCVDSRNCDRLCSIRQHRKSSPRPEPPLCSENGEEDDHLGKSNYSSINLHLRPRLLRQSEGRSSIGSTLWRDSSSAASVAADSGNVNPPSLESHRYLGFYLRLPLFKVLRSSNNHRPTT